MNDNEKRAHDIAIAYTNAMLIKLPGSDLQSDLTSIMKPNDRENALYKVYLPIYRQVLNRLKANS